MRKICPFVLYIFCYACCLRVLWVVKGCNPLDIPVITCQSHHKYKGVYFSPCFASYPAPVYAWDVVAFIPQNSHTRKQAGLYFLCQSDLSNGISAPFFLISLMHTLTHENTLSLGYRKRPSIASLFQQYSPHPSSSVMHILSMLLNAAGSPFCLCVCVCAHMCLSGCVHTRVLQCVWGGGQPRRTQLKLLEFPANSSGP